MVGNILTGIFSASWIANLDGGDYPPMGWIEQHYIQLGYQLAGICAAFSWSFVLSCLILFLMNLVPGLALRVSVDDEEIGADDCQLGEFAYDYVELTRHVADSGSSAHGVAISSNASATGETHEKNPTETV